MSIYIKGMEMPTDNTVLLRIYPKNDGVCYVEQLDIDDDILDKYWAVPVPEHGDLIDRDKIVYIKDDSNLADFDYAYRLHINSLPTIIPAEEGEG